jgi:hypothetical protein
VGDLRRGTVLGAVDVRWQLVDGTMRVEVDLPSGVEAEVVLPDDPKDLVESG